MIIGRDNVCIKCDLLVTDHISAIGSGLEELLRELVGEEYGFILLTFPMEARVAVKGMVSNQMCVDKLIKELNSALKLLERAKEVGMDQAVAEAKRSAGSVQKH
jgi:hypothetical protein